MTRKLPAEAAERIRALLRERDYASAAAYAEMTLDSLGIDPAEPPPVPPVAFEPMKLTVTEAATTVGDEMASIFEADS
jgi:hypothetical protein